MLPEGLEALGELPMKTTLFISMLAALTMLAPTGMAFALPDYDDCTTRPGVVDRAACTAKETVDAAWGVVGPTEELVRYEVAWATGLVIGTVNEACEHALGQPCTRIEMTDEFPIQLLA